MSFTYYVIKNEDLYGKLKNDGSMIDYVYGPEPSKIWWRNLWTAPNLCEDPDLIQPVFVILYSFSQITTLIENRLYQLHIHTLSQLLFSR